MEAIKIAESLYDIFNQLPREAQSEFLRILHKEGKLVDWTDEDWQRLGLEGFADEWDRPENDVWDQFYQDQEGNV